MADMCSSERPKAQKLQAVWYLEDGGLASIVADVVSEVLRLMLFFVLKASPWKPNLRVKIELTLCNNGAEM
jgi:hypothetical protein